MTVIITVCLLTVFGCSALEAATLATRYAPTSTTTHPPTTLPQGCVTEDGEVVGEGEERTMVEAGACRLCSCYSGRLSCSYGDCLVAMCVDARRPPGACCATCPHGPNCRVPATGEVIPGGRPVMSGGQSCRCPQQNYMLPGVQSEADYTALCTPLTTIPAPSTTLPWDWTASTIPVGRR